MRKVLLAVMVLFSMNAVSEGWEGKKVKIPKGTLLCEYYAMDKALVLQKAGAHTQLNTMINNGACAFAPDTIFAIVTKDASDFTDPSLAEVMIRELSIWVEMDAVECCYK